MTHEQYLSLNINRVDRMAAEQTGYPALFYTIKRCYGDNEASLYLKAWQDGNLANLPE